MKSGVCTVCGDPTVALCTRRHREIVVIQLSELQKGDLLLRPTSVVDPTGGPWRMFLVTEVTDCPDGSVQIETGQSHTLYMLYPELPILVKREVACNWARCELHCGKCLRYAEEEQRRDELLQRANAEHPAANDSGEERQHKSKSKKNRKTVGLPEEAPPKHLRKRRPY